MQVDVFLSGSFISSAAVAQLEERWSVVHEEESLCLNQYYWLGIYTKTGHVFSGYSVRFAILVTMNKLAIKSIVIIATLP